VEFDRLRLLEFDILIEFDVDMDGLWLAELLADTLSLRDTE
jgi:hypothetical protein